MKVVFHIGMGKTGTSAIQRALAENEQALRAQGATYMGMWFDAIDPRYRGLANQQEFFKLRAPEMRETGAELHRILAARTAAEGIETFIWSNESFSGKSRVMVPMMRRLMHLGAEVHLIAWVRNPTDWLASAYAQWGLRHKVEPGPIQPFGVKARKLVRWYQGLLDWHEALGERLEVRSYERAPDIVADLGQALGLTLPMTGQRVLERAEPAEMVLRALFNDRIEGAVLPSVFDQTVVPGLGHVPRLQDVADQCFDLSEAPQIIAEQAELFDRLAAICGFDPRTEPTKAGRMPDPAALRERLMDALIHVVLDQAHRIRLLEKTLGAAHVAPPRRASTAD